jgi:TonB-linked SusC/RagA family outer membrane protein
MRRLLFFPLLLLSFFLQGQENLNRVLGLVSDKSGDPIPYANIRLKNNIVAATTAVDGSFVINLASLDMTLIFSAVGYQEQEVEVAGNKFLNVILEDKYSELDEAVVVGYGSLQKSVITGAISSVKNKEFKDQPVTVIGNAIQGKLAGVNIVTPSGTPGAGMLFNIRGSFNPLYVVDGIPLLSENNSALETSYDLEGNSVGRGQSVTSIADINPNDIESIEVLKDASAAAIYGSRAANGVVLITTKRGTADRTEFGVNTYSGVQEVSKKIPFLSGTELRELLEDARQQDLAIYNKDNNAFNDIDGFNPAMLSDSSLTKFAESSDLNTVWLDEVMRRAPVRNVEVYARGGNNRTKFHISGNYFDQQGIVLNSGFTRSSARLNLDHRVSEHFSLGNTLSLSRSVNQRSFNDNTYTGVITNAIGASPFMPAYEDDGSYANYEDYEATWLSENPVKSAKEVKATTITNRVLGSIFADYRFNNALKFRTSWSIDYTDLTDNQFISPLMADVAEQSGKGFYNTFKAINWVGENYLSYRKAILEDHTFDVVLGTSMQSSTSARTRIAVQNFPKGSGLQNIGAAGQILNSNSYNGALGIVSYYGRFNYDYKNKLIVALSGRVDGSSRFPTGQQYAFFPSLSVGYRIVGLKPEDLEKVLTDLKFRMSYGVTGDQEIGDFRQKDLYGPSRYNGTSTLVPTVLANPILSWQENRIFNTGIDFELRKGRVAGAIEAFVSNKGNLLFDRRVAGTTGFPTVTSNAGKTRSMGAELTLYSTLVNLGKFRWTGNFNLTYMKTKYTELDEDDQIVSAYSDIAPTHIVKVGHPVGTFWGVKYTGVDPDTGDATFEDLNGDGEINNDDAQILGQAFPTLFGGLNTGFVLNKFDLNIASQFSYGNQIYNLIRATYDNGGWANGGFDENNNLTSIYANNSANMKKRWRKPGDVTDVPRASLLTQNYVEASSMYIEDGSFWRIRTINLGYTMKRVRKFDSIRIFAQVQNPFIWTKYSGFDPEVSSTGADRGSEQTAGVDFAAYPQARTYTFGLNVVF